MHAERVRQIVADHRFGLSEHAGAHSTHCGDVAAFDVRSNGMEEAVGVSPAASDADIAAALIPCCCGEISLVHILKGQAPASRVNRAARRAIALTRRSCGPTVHPITTTKEEAKRMTTRITHVLLHLGEGKGYEKHALADVDQPLTEGWKARCGMTIFRSRAILAHPLLPARICEGCANASMR